jgi:UDP-N-acetylglucosamine 2-epimerase
MSPWPEEINRRLVSPLSRLHFAPTERAAENLTREGIHNDQIFVTGNTVIDALRWTASRPEGDQILDLVLKKFTPNLLNSERRILLITLHRRENLGEKLRSICGGLKAIAERGDVELVFPVHLNPAVQEIVQDVLGKIKAVHLLPPLDYLPFVALLRRSYIVITDSGGIQEEAPGLGKPVVVARDTTERPEAIEAGTAKLVGTNGDEIFKTCAKLLDSQLYYSSMANAINPFGDGHSAERIVKLLQNHS